MKPLRIAMIGQKGLPATFGGVEHHVEEIGARLAARGHQITVYSRPNYSTDAVDRYRDMAIRQLPTVNTKHLDALAHSALCTIDAMRRRAHIIHYHAIGPGLVAPLPRYLGPTKVVLTVHGRDALREKWGPGASQVLRLAEWMSARVPDATVVVSEDLAAHYARAYRTRSHYIPNGVDPPASKPADLIEQRWGLTEGSYALFVGRLVPEKAPDLLIRAFRRIDTHQRLVITGGSSFTNDYVRELELAAASDDRVLMTGYVFGDELSELYTNASAFVLPSTLEGLPLTLLEAASYGTPIVASDIPPAREVLGADGPGRRLFRTGSERDLVATLTLVMADPGPEREGAKALRDEVIGRYRWDEAVDRLEGLYRRLTR